MSKSSRCPSNRDDQSDSDSLAYAADDYDAADVVDGDCDCSYYGAVVTAETVQVDDYGADADVVTWAVVFANDADYAARPVVEWSQWCPC